MKRSSMRTRLFAILLSISMICSNTQLMAVYADTPTVSTVSEDANAENPTSGNTEEGAVVDSAQADETDAAASAVETPDAAGTASGAENIAENDEISSVANADDASADVPQADAVDPAEETDAAKDNSAADSPATADAKAAADSTEDKSDSEDGKDSEDQTASEEVSEITLTDAESGIKVKFRSDQLSLPDGAKASDVRLKIKKSEASEQTLYRDALKLKEADTLKAQDIALVIDKDGAEVAVQPLADQKITVTIPLGEKPAGTMEIYRGDTSGWTKLENQVKPAEGTTAEQNQYVVEFETEHFTPFAAVEVAEEAGAAPAAANDANANDATDDAGDEQEEDPTFDLTVQLAASDEVKEYVGTSSSYSGYYVLYRQYKGLSGEWTKLQEVRLYATKADESRYPNTVTWTDLPKKDPVTGLEYEYAVVRSSANNLYKPLTSDHNTGEYTVISTGDSYVDHWNIEETTSVSVSISWSDDNDANGYRPDSLTLLLNYGDPDDVREITVEKNEDGSWPNGVFENVPIQYNGNYVTYRVSTSGLTRYNGGNSSRSVKSGTSLSITNTLIADMITAIVGFSSIPDAYSYTTIVRKSTAEERGWDYPENIVAKVYRGDTLVTSHTFSSHNSNGWTTSSLQKVFYIPKTDENGETLEGDLTIRWESDFIDNEQYRTTVNSASTSSRLTITYPVVSYNTFTRTWDDENNALGLRPSNNPMLQILANGESIETGTSFLYLPKYDTDGEEIEYSIEPVDLPAYYEAIIATTLDSRSNSYLSYYNPNTVTYRYKDEQSFTVNVEFEGNATNVDSERDNRPSETNLLLQYSADGGKTWQNFWGKNTAVITDSTASRSYTWEKLPGVDADGNKILYRAVQLDELSLYTTEEDDPVVTTEDGVTTTTQTIHNAYNDNWNYKIDFHWNKTGTEKYDQSYVGYGYDDYFYTQYILSVSVQKPYEVGALQIEIPYELFERRNSSKGVVPTDMTIGDENNPSGAYKFTYRIDNKGTTDTSDDVVIFYNYKELAASDNFTVPISYGSSSNVYYWRDVEDFSFGELTINATGQYVGQDKPEEQTSRSITYRADTGASIRAYSGNQVKRFESRVYYWNESLYGPKPEDFDLENHRYFTYLVSYYAIGNQPFEITHTDTPGDGGRVESVRYLGTYMYNSSTSVGGSSVAFDWDEEAGTATWKRILNSYARGYPYYYRVVVRYDKDAGEVNEDGTKVVHNDIKMDLATTDDHEGDKQEGDKDHPRDYNDIASVSGSASAEWVDYVPVYPGYIWAAEKNMGEFPTAGLTILENGVEVSDAVSNVSLTVNGYTFENGYRIELLDDAVYADVYDADNKIIQTVRLDQEDYELSGTPRVTIVSSDIDRTNGQTLDGQVPEDPFILWGRKGNSGTWEQIYSFQMEKSSSTVYTVPESISGKGYTALKVTSPAGLKNYFDVRFSGFSVTVKPDSPKLKAYYQNSKEIPRIRITNFSGHELFVTDEDGEESLFMTGSNSEASRVGLRVHDMTEFGTNIVRRNDASNLTRVTYTSDTSKSMSTTTNASARTSTLNVTLRGTEYINTATLPDEVYQNFSADTGIFYDLLPAGYSLDTKQPIIVYAGNSPLTSLSGANSANGALVSYETINNYNGTGRQLVKFTVKANAEGKNIFGRGRYINNIYQYYPATGFEVNFKALASLEDLVTNTTIYNIMTYERGDGKEIVDARGDDGDPGNISNKQQFFDEDGNAYFYDMDGDGETPASTNLYALGTTTLNFQTAIENGLRKQVKGRSSYYVLDDITDIDADYSYRLTLTTARNGDTSNLILYDILENAENTEGHTGEAGWKGTITGTGLGNLARFGIQGVVYYSTTQNMDYNAWTDKGHLIEDDPEGTWIAASEYTGDLAKVTAVAFDLRNGVDGEPVIIPENSTLYVEIFMHAPDAVQDQEYAYNRPAYHSNFTAAGLAEGKQSFNISNRTTIKLVTLQDIAFRKTFLGDDEEAKPLPGATFELYRCTYTPEETDGTTPAEEHTHGNPAVSSSCWEKIGTTLSDAQGDVIYRDLESGIYAVRETNSGRIGITTLANRYWIFTVDDRRGTVSNPVAVSTSPGNYPAVEMTKIKKEDSEEETEIDPDEVVVEWQLDDPRQTVSIRPYKYWYDSYISNRLRTTELTFNLYRKLSTESDEAYELIATKTGYNTSKNTGYYNDKDGNPLFANLHVANELGMRYMYRVTEEPIDGYAESTAWTSSSSLSGGNVNAYFYNYALGTVRIAKSVKGTLAEDTFDFTVTISDSEGNPYTETVTYRRYASLTAFYAGTTYTDEKAAPSEAGVFDLKLAKDEVVLLTNLPYNANVTVTEATGEDYHTVVTSQSGGTTSTNGDVNSWTTTLPPRVSYTAQRYVDFQNTQRTIDFDLPISKTLNGNTPEGFGEDFEFTIESVNVSPEADESAIEITNSGNGHFDITFTDTDNITSKYTEYRYVIKEKAGTNAQIAYDEKVYTVTVRVGRNSDYSLYARIVSIVQRDSSEEGATSKELGANGKVAFTNTYHPTPVDLSIPVHKIVEGTTPDNKTFTFKLSAVSANAPMPEAVEGIDRTVAAVTGSGTQNFGAIHYTQAGTYTYKVTETKGSEKGYTYDETEHTVVVTVADEKGELKASFTVDGEEAEQVTITNIYEPASAELAIPVTKKFSEASSSRVGHLLNFTFKLEAETENAPMPESDTITIADTTGTGTVVGTNTFAPITFTQAGTYDYKLYEVAQTGKEVEEYTFDTAVRELEVVVTDEGGELKIAWTVNDIKPDEKEGAVFTNKYAVNPTDLQIPITKVVLGNPPEDSDFEFTATLTLEDFSENGDTSPSEDGDTPSSEDKPDVGKNHTLTIKGAGTESFHPIEFTKAGVYTYKLTETDKGEAGYSYDKTERTLVITVQNDRGDLKASYTVEGGTGLAFVNTYTPESVKLEIPVGKNVNGNARPKSGEQFLFELQGDGEAPMPAKSTLTITDDGDENLQKLEKFGAITFTKAGTYTYELEEHRGTTAGMTYDIAERQIKVEVQDIGGKLVIDKVTVTVDGKDTEIARTETENEISMTALLGALRIQNSYAVTPTTVTLPVFKEISGVPREVSEKIDFTFELAAITDGAPMPEKDGKVETSVSIKDEGSADFETVTFTKAGIYQYTLTEKKEDKGTNLGYAYDEVKRIVTVTVEDRESVLHATYTVRDENDGALTTMFRNTFAPTPTYLDLKVTKEITGGHERPKEKSFTFTLAAVNEGSTTPIPMPESDSTVITGAGDGSFGRITYNKSGVYKYILTEKAGTDTGYTYDGTEWTITVLVKNENGVLKAISHITDSGTESDKREADGSTELTAKFSNNYKPNPTSLEIPVAKVVSGDPRPDSNEKFRFTLTAETEGAPMPEESTITIADDGKEDFKEESSFGEITFTKAGVYTYALTEEAGNRNNMTYDTAERIITVTVTDASGNLAVSYEVSSETEKKDTLTFTNSYTPDPVTWTLPVQKSVTGNVRPKAGEEYIFELESGTSGTPMPDKTEVRITDDGTEGFTETAEFGAITFTHAGVYTYMVEELAGETNRMTYDTEEHVVKVTVTDKDGALEVSAVTVDGIETDEVAIENNYDPDDAELEIPVSKKLEGQMRPTEKTFTFVLRASDDKNPMPGNDTLAAAQITGGGATTFSKIIFTEAGTYRYTMQERDLGETGYTYDRSIYSLTVTVTDEDGVLQADLSIQDGEGTDTDAVFTNAYTPNPTEITLPVAKVITGDPRPEGQEQGFTFEIEAVTEETETEDETDQESEGSPTGASDTETDADAGTDTDTTSDTETDPIDQDDAKPTPMPEENTVTITDEGNAAFGEINFTEAGIYRYRITEKDEGLTGYTYDPVEYFVTVTVTDNDGNLEATYQIEDGSGVAAEDLTFTNAYEPNPVDVDLPLVTKVIEGNERPDEQTFSFVLRALDDAPLPNDSETDPNDTDEDDPADRDEESDTEERNDNDTVDPSETSGDNEAEESTDVRKDTETGNSGEEPNDDEADASADESNDDTEDPQDEDRTYTVTITGEGSTELGTITYTKPGIYQYTLQEVQDGQTGYTYDAQQHTIVVTVTDDYGVLRAVVTLDGVAPEVDEELDTEANLEAIFTNLYEPKEAVLQIPVRKAITGDKRPQESVFRFEITAEEGDPVPETDSTSILGEGENVFGMIRYTKAGKYHYTIKEVDDGLTGYTYDTEVHSVTVTVTDQAGVLQAEYEVDGDPDAEVLFTNHYQPKETTVTFEAVKKLTGGTLKEGQFTFILIDEEGEVQQLAQNAEDGSVKFREITFTEPGDHAYTISERKGTDEQIEYDETVYTVNVSVTDQNGELKAETDTKNAQILFTNKVKDPEPDPDDDPKPTPDKDPEKGPETTVVLGAVKKLEGGTLRKNQFTFILNDENGEKLQQAKNDADGNILFRELTYTKPGTYTYTISEKAGTSTSIEYDETVYTVKVIVTEKDGKLTAEADQTADQIVFTNKVKTSSRTTTGGGTRGTGRGVRTGDTSAIGLLLAMLLASAASLAALLRRRRKQK